MVGRALPQAVRGEWQGRRPLASVPLAPKDNQESRWWSEEVGAPMVDNGRTRRADCVRIRDRMVGGNVDGWDAAAVACEARLWVGKRRGRCLGCGATLEGATAAS